MKILFISGHYPPHTKGGGEISTHLIAQGLRQLGHDVVVITSKPKGGNHGEREEYEVGGVPVVALNIPLTAKPLLEKRASRKMAKVLGREIGDPGKYDFIHAHDWRSTLVLLEMGVKNAVATIRDYAQICGTTNNILADGNKCTCSWYDVLRSHRVKEAGWIRKLFRIWQYKFNIGYRRKAFRKMKAQIFISKAQREVTEGQQDLTGIQTEVIYNPVAAEYLSKVSVKGIGGRVLYAGTVEMYKGVGLLLAAWREVVKECGNTELRIVGDGAQRKEYEKLVENWGLQYKVKFEGRMAWNRLRKMYDEASVVAAPHIWIEPFGRTVVEAMARGKVVVAADAGGPAETIKDNVSGMLFKKGSVKDLSKRLREALQMSVMSRDEISRNARKWAQENLSQEAIAKKYERFYAGLTH